jgi:hypothetical protein
MKTPGTFLFGTHVIHLSPLHICAHMLSTYECSAAHRRRSQGGGVATVELGRLDCLHGLAIIRLFHLVGEAMRLSVESSITP